MFQVQKVCQRSKTQFSNFLRPFPPKREKQQTSYREKWSEIRNFAGPSVDQNPELSVSLGEKYKQ